MNRTSIEWVRNPDGSPGFTYNPVTGCETGCSWCYARRIARRFGKTTAERAFRPQFHPDRLDEPLRRKKPSGIFVGSMCDLFGDWVPRGLLIEVLRVTWEASNHTFMFLTKNPKRYRSFKFPRNAWLGFTAVDQDAYNAGSIHMSRMAHNMTFVSIEPMLSPVRLETYAPSWVIVGPLSGPGAKQPNRRWVQNLIADARRSDVSVFLKDKLDWHGHRPQEFPEERRVRC